MPRGKRGKPPEDRNEPQSPIPAGEAPQFVGTHQEFLNDETPLQCLEGARFSGKTWVCCAKVVNYCVNHPGMEWLVCRYSKDDAVKFLKPVFQRVANRMGHFPVWEDEAFIFSNGSRATVAGLRSQEKQSHLAKVRGRDMGGVWNDQSEELPKDIGEELPFATRQPGYPHIVILSPNPPDEDSWISDFFPEDNSITGRKYWRVSLYDNPFCPEDKLAELERLYAPTHSKYKKLILGLRGPDVSGDAIYADAFERELHVGKVLYDPDNELLEAFDMGRHNPVWMVAQRNYFGGFQILGGIMGKRMFVRDFLQIVQKHRDEWFPRISKLRTCCDPPPAAHDINSTNIKILRDARLRPIWRDHANAPDVRESVIQTISGLMRQRLGRQQAVYISDNPAHWLMASSVIIKQHTFFVGGCESSYCWDPYYISVGSKKIRQPIVNEWVDGAQRCLENIVLNFGMVRSQEERERRTAAMRGDYGGSSSSGSSSGSWLGS